MRHERMLACSGLGGILSFFFERDDDFWEVRDFVDEMDARYALDVHKVHGDFKGGIERLTAASGIRAIFLGTRRQAFPSRPFFPAAYHLQAPAANLSRIYEEWRITRQFSAHVAGAIQMLRIRMSSVPAALDGRPSCE